MRKCNNNAAYADILMERIGVNNSYWKMVKIQMIEIAFVFAFIISVISLSAYILNMKKVPFKTKVAANISLSYPVIIMSIADITFTNIIK